MSVCDADPEIPVFVDPKSKAGTAVIALIDRSEFAWAQTAIVGLNGYCDYEEWRDSREGFQMGLAMAGVAAEMLRIALTPFLAWCRITGAPPTERALDVFALTVSLFRKPTESAVFAVVAKQEFEAHSRDVAALSAYGDYERWVSHRQAIRESAVNSGLRVEELPILIDDFIKWSACAGQFSKLSGWSIDRYAQLALEYFSLDFAEAGM